MNRRSVDRLPLLVLALLSGCTIAGTWSQPPSHDEEGARWMVVEQQIGDMVDRGAWPAGQMEPGATILAMTLVSASSTKWEPIIHARDCFVEVLATSPQGRVEVGRTVTISVRVGNAKPNAIYKLTASPGGGTRILGQHEHIVEESEETQFRFTRVEDGVGVIRVDVEVLR